MATFAEQMVERPPNATCRVWSLAEKQRALLAESAGLKAVTVDGQSVTQGELEERLRYWGSRAVAEGGHDQAEQRVLARMIATADNTMADRAAAALAELARAPARGMEMRMARRRRRAG